MGGALDRLAVALNPQDEDEQQAIKQLAILDEATIATLHRMHEREVERIYDDDPDVD